MIAARPRPGVNARTRIPCLAQPGGVILAGLPELPAFPDCTAAGFRQAP